MPISADASWLLIAQTLPYCLLYLVVNKPQMAGDIDRLRAPLYSRGMVDVNAVAASVDVAGLSLAVDALIERCDGLQQDNDNLRLEMARMAAERVAVDKAQQLARERVTLVISRLKALEE